MLLFWAIRKRGVLDINPSFSLDISMNSPSNCGFPKHLNAVDAIYSDHNDLIASYKSIASSNETGNTTDEGPLTIKSCASNKSYSNITPLRINSLEIGSLNEPLKSISFRSSRVNQPIKPVKPGPSIVNEASNEASNEALNEASYEALDKALNEALNEVSNKSFYEPLNETVNWAFSASQFDSGVNILPFSAVSVNKQPGTGLTNTCEPKHNEEDYMDAFVLLVYRCGMLKNTNLKFPDAVTRESIKEEVLKTLVMCELVLSQSPHKNEMRSTIAELLALVCKANATAHELLDVCLKTLVVLHSVYPVNVLKSYLVDMGVDCTALETPAAETSSVIWVPRNEIRSFTYKHQFKSCAPTSMSSLTARIPSTPPPDYIEYLPRRSVEIIRSLQACLSQKCDHLKVRTSYTTSTEPKPRLHKGFRQKLHALTDPIRKMVSCRQSEKEGN